MKLVVAADVDGTLDCSMGPVSVDSLRNLDMLDDCTVVIVSPSGKRPQGFAEEVSGDRLANLLAVRRRFPANIYIYVSDNSDNALSAQAGFVHCHPNDFRLPEE